MNLQKRILTAFVFSASVVFIIAAVVFIWQTQPVKAVQNSERAFGIISLNAGQTLRFNVVNIGNPNDRRVRRVKLAFDVYALGGPDTISEATSSEAAVAACTNNLRFVRRESCEVTLLPGEAASLDFTAPTGRTQIGAVMLGGPDTREDPTLVPTLEIREGNRTLFVHPGAAKGFNPQPDPPGRAAQ